LTGESFWEENADCPGGQTKKQGRREMKTGELIILWVGGLLAVVNALVGSGFVASLARPGGNITGSSTLAPVYLDAQISTVIWSSQEMK
jgi:hypothetical protein